MNSYYKNTGNSYVNSMGGLPTRKRTDSKTIEMTHWRNTHRRGAVKTVLVSFWLTLSVSMTASTNAQNQTVGVADNPGATSALSGESEFDNHSDTYVKDWRNADSNHEDTVFGERMYNEASTPTKLEMLRLISKDTPSTQVLLHAVSMGLDLDEVLQAAVRYEPSKGRDMAASAVELIPIMASESSGRLYSSYELEDLDREDDTKPYSVSKVIDRFFKERQVLRPYPDWFDGQYHFLASAAELKSLQTSTQKEAWYKSKSFKDSAKRPVFVSLYEGTDTVLIDSRERIEQALKDDANALLPVVFIFNRTNERSVDGLTYIDEEDKQGREYARTIRGVQKAYLDKNLMLTPAPEWQIGDYHLQGSIEEVSQVFDLPEERDFEPEAWQNLVEEAKKYTVENTSFIVAIMPKEVGDDSNASKLGAQNVQYASWDDPRTEGRFKYVQPRGDDRDRDADDSYSQEPVNLKRLLSEGLVINRPDLIAALKHLGVSSVPVSFYYADPARVAPYTGGPRALIQAAIGAGAPPGSFGDGGGFLPPPVETPPPASPPGIQ